MGWIFDVAAGALRGSGNSDLADWLKDAPTKLGEEIGKILVKGQKDDGTISDVAIEQLEELRKREPIVAPQPHELVDEYAVDLNAFVKLAISGESREQPTVVAVRGFLHDPQSCAVWVIDARNFKPMRVVTLGSDIGSNEITVAAGPVRIYLLPPKTDEELVQVNLQIARNRADFLTNLENNYQYMVRGITKNHVTVEAMPKSGKHSGQDSNLPIIGRAGIAEAFKTLEPALTTQATKINEYRKDRLHRGTVVP